MKRYLAFAMLLAALAVASPSFPVRAAEDAAAAPSAADAGKDASKDSGKKEEGKKPPANVSGGRFAGDPVYVHLAPLILPIITDAGAEQIVTLQIAIEVRDFDAADTLQNNMPKVMDALMRTLYGGLGNGSLRDGQLVDVVKIKNKAVKALGDALGADNIRDVLVEAVAQRRL